MKSVRIWVSAVTLVLSIAASARAQATSAPPPPPATVQPASAPDPGWEVEIAPIYLWAPIYIGKVTAPEFPELPPPPGGGNRPTGETDAGLSGAAMAAVRVEKGRWMARGNFVWLGLSGEKETPFLEVSGDVIYGEFFGGVELAKHLYVEAGVRRLAIDVTARVLDYPEVSRKPGIWDPIVGMTYRLPMGSHFLWTFHGDGGGFGVGSEVDLNASVVLDWRIVRHVGLTVGYAATYFRIEDTLLDNTRIERTLELGANFYGPIIGFKLLF